MLPQHKLLTDPLGMMVASLAINVPRTPQSTYERMKADSESGMVVGHWKGVNQYCVDCWMIFIMGEVVDTKYQDLREYLEWCRDNGVPPPAYTIETTTGSYIARPQPLRIMRITPR